MEKTAVSVGDRVDCDGARGTVKWKGEVPGTEGTWYGVDWDCEARGKHDGSHKGVQYFKARSPSSGSFVRAAKVSAGMTLEEAVRGRYQDDPTIESQHTEQLQKTIKARFVEVVGMEKIGKKQSKLDELENVVLDGWNVYGSGASDLYLLLPRVQELNLSNSLLASWESVAQITRQLPRLRFLDISGNSLSLPEHPEVLQESLSHVSHLVLNHMVDYNWQDILTCCRMFPTLMKLQVAFNNMSSLSAVPGGLLECLKELDIGANPIPSWDEICQLGILPKLESLNANDCLLEAIDFPDTSSSDKTRLFPCLKNLTIANNPLDKWEAVGNLNKLPQLENLVMTYDHEKDVNFQEYAFARISSLMVFNRSRINNKEKRDCELFYMKSFSEDYFSSGGKEDLAESKPLEEFLRKHPNYMKLIEEHGSPIDESSFKSQKLKDLKIAVTIRTPNDPAREPFCKAFLPSTKVAKIKMMLKRHLKISPAIKLTLTYCTEKNDESFEIPIDNDMKEIEYYSITTGDVILARW